MAKGQLHLIASIDSMDEGQYSMLPRILRNGIITAFCLFFITSTSFYFFDSTVYLPEIVPNLISLVSIALLLFLFEYFHLFSLKENAILIFLFSVFVIYMCIAKLVYADDLSFLAIIYPFSMLFFFYLILLVSQDHLAIQAYKVFLVLFIISCIPGLLIYPTIVFNAKVPYTIIHLGGRSFSYRNYFNLAIYTDYSITSFFGIFIPRLCGMFEEPGMLGTYCGMFLIMNAFLDQKSKKMTFFLILIGILTLSTTFYILLFAVILYGAIQKNGISALLKRLFIIMAYIVILIVLVMQIPVFKDFVNTFIFRGVATTDTFSFLTFIQEVESDRSGNTFENFLRYLQEADGFRLFLGNGPGSNSRNTDAGFTNVVMLVYEWGIIGCFIILSITLYYYFYLPIVRKKCKLLFLTVPLLMSIYQRPSINTWNYYLSFIMLARFLRNADREGNIK